MASLSRKVPGVLRLLSNGCVQNQRRFEIARRQVVTGNVNIDKALNTATAGKIEGWMKAYERLVGLTEVREAQHKVIQAEHGFTVAQMERRGKQDELHEVQQRMRAVGAELEKVHRGEERYLALLTQEHNIIREEKGVIDQIALCETEERLKFSTLSSSVRESHEKERARTERTKYWSIIGSVVGAAIGILGTSLNNYLRMRELRGIVSDSAEGGIELRGLVTDLSGTMRNQHNQMSSFISDLKDLVTQGKDGKGAVVPVNAVVASNIRTEQLEEQTRQIMGAIHKQDTAVEQEIRTIKDILASSKAVDSEGNIIYVGPQVEGMLENTEKNLEWKLKMNALWTVTFIYGAFALTLPILYNIFRGS